MLQRSKFNSKGILIVIVTAIMLGYLFALLSGAATIKGDINNDGKVDITDLSIVLSNYGKAGTLATGDADGNGIVNVIDLSIVLSNYGATTVTTNPAGQINFIEKTNPNTDSLTNSPTATTQQWMRDHWKRAIVYTTYWDSKLSWFPNAWVYLDSYAIYATDSTLINQHPDWILKDGAGNRLYIPFDCNGTTCTQYAADIGNPAWQQFYINNVKSQMSKGYKGVFVDDVDMDLNTSNGTGAILAPIDPRTGTTMTDTAWKSYFATFMENLRNQVPNNEIVHNSVWFAGGGNHDATNPYIVRQIKAANVIDLEHGINDSGLTGGTGIWSIYAIFRYVDNIHSYGNHVIFQSYATDLNSIEYNLSGYLLVNDGNDYIASDGGNLPSNWWPGYDINLGAASGARYMWNGVWRRDFANGIVLLNEPGASTKSLNLGATYRTALGVSTSTINLNASQGAVLQK
jgi:hypothetical protein